MDFKYLDEYINDYVKNNGLSTEPGYLHKLIIYFRKAFDKLGMSDNCVPEFFDWDDETSEDFFTWGHNSRWSNTFATMLDNNLNDYVDKLKSTMVNNEIDDFKVNYK